METTDILPKVDGDDYQKPVDLLSLLCEDVVFHILSYLSASDLYRLGWVSQSLRLLSSTSRIWTPHHDRLDLFTELHEFKPDEYTQMYVGQPVEKMSEGAAERLRELLSLFSDEYVSKFGDPGAVRQLAHLVEVQEAGEGEGGGDAGGRLSRRIYEMRRGMRNDRDMGRIVDPRGRARGIVRAFGSLLEEKDIPRSRWALRAFAASNLRTYAQATAKSLGFTDSNRERYATGGCKWVFFFLLYRLLPFVVLICTFLSGVMLVVDHFESSSVPYWGIFALVAAVAAILSGSCLCVSAIIVDGCYGCVIRSRMRPVEQMTEFVTYKFHQYAYTALVRKLEQNSSFIHLFLPMIFAGYGFWAVAPVMVFSFSLLKWMDAWGLFVPWTLFALFICYLFLYWKLLRRNVKQLSDPSMSLKTTFGVVILYVVAVWMSGIAPFTLGVLGWYWFAGSDVFHYVVGGVYPLLVVSLSVALLIYSCVRFTLGKRFSRPDYNSIMTVIIASRVIPVILIFLAVPGCVYFFLVASTSMHYAPIALSVLLLFPVVGCIGWIVMTVLLCALERM